MSEKFVIELQNISKSYDGRTILSDINLSIKEGEIVSIVGGSGCGKSTLLRQIIGLEKPTEGKVFIDGDDFTAADGDDRRKILRKFGVLFQSGGLFASMTLAENIALVLQTYSDLDDNRILDIINMKLSSVGIGGYEDFLPSEISGGMKKRAALARAMALDPKILCFDEPSSGLDPITSAELDKLIKELNSNLGTTMIVVTHDLASILDISSRIIMLDQSVKGIIAEGTPEEMRNYKNNQYVYNFFNRIT